MGNSNRRKFLKLSGLLGLSSYTGRHSVSDSLTEINYDPGKNKLEEIRRQALKKYEPIFNMSGYAAPKIDRVKVGFIGVGNRGAAAVRRVSQIEGVSVRAICDVRKSSAEAAQAKVKVKPEEATLYVGSPDAWKKVCERDDIDLIYICTPWSLHVDMAVYAMEHGKHVAVEVPAAKTVEECWKLVLTSEKTRKHCVMLENCCYDFFELITLNMARRNFFGDIIHCEGAYIHDLLESLFDQNERYEHWRLTENATRNGNLYPTHGFGPICQVLKINRGNKLEYMSSMASRDFSMGPMAAEKAASDPYVNQIKQAAFRGNMNTSTIMTHSGATVMLQHDVTSPRPYSRLHTISGTKAYAQKYPLPARIALGHEKFVSEEEMKKLEAEYTPGIVTKIGELAKKVGGHGGMDFMMDWRLINCLRRGLPVDMDVYDAAAWSVIGPLSEYSVANGSQPIPIPDFTMGRWQKNQVHDINLKD